MNCVLCQDYLDAWLAGTLPDHLRIQVEDHLNHCRQCCELADLIKISETVFREEKVTEPNPFIATRVMAALAANENRTFREAPALIRLLKPLTITLSMAAAVFAGIVLGKLSDSASTINRIPSELVLMNDTQMEAITQLSTE